MMVLVFYQKGGGENGRHGWILSTPSVHNLSNVGVQLFEYTHHQQSGCPLIPTYLNLIQLFHLMSHGLHVSLFRPYLEENKEKKMVNKTEKKLRKFRGRRR